MGYAAKPKDYKKHPEEYKGHVGHVSTVIRLAVAGRSQSPDIWEIQQILGEREDETESEMLIGSQLPGSIVQWNRLEYKILCINELLHP